MKIEVGGTVVTAAITNAPVDELTLGVGKEAYAVVKASDVMIGIDAVAKGTLGCHRSDGGARGQPLSPALPIGGISPGPPQGTP